MKINKIDDSKNSNDDLKKQISKTRLWQGVSLLAILLFALFGFFMFKDKMNITGNVVAEQNEGAIEFDNDPVMGNKDAPVTITAYEDFQCPFCSAVFEMSFPQVKQQYIDTGKVKYVFKQFPLVSIHSESLPAALASECAHEQEKFWEYHDGLYFNQGSLGVDFYLALAESLQLDNIKFKQCLESSKYQDEVQDDFNEGVRAGVTGTPAFFINDQLIVGSHPFENFKKAIDSELDDYS